MSVEKQIEGVVDAILEDYRKDRDIDRMATMALSTRRLAPSAMSAAPMTRKRKAPPDRISWLLPR